MSTSDSNSSHTDPRQSKPAPQVPQPPPPPQQQPAWNTPYAAQYAQYAQYTQYYANIPYRQQYPVQGANNWPQVQSVNNWPQPSYQQQYHGYPAPSYYGHTHPFGSLGNPGSQVGTTPQVYEAPQYLPAGGSQTKEKDLPSAIVPARQGNEKKGRDKKIMLPAPSPTADYLAQAAEDPFVIDPPDRMLVILDLNGTLIYRPNPRKQATRLVSRPFLKPFLRYLFEHFSVIIWSSAKPENVKVIVENVLDDELRSMLLACLARDSFKLEPHHYSLNVQVYKDLKIIWDDEEIQRKIPDYEYGKTFGQHNTILIDDTTIKASAQPHNLLLIPEFAGSEEDMKGDVLREVAGYLEILKMQWDVSMYMRKDPFKANGRWQYEWDWEDASNQGGELVEKVSRTHLEDQDTVQKA